MLAGTFERSILDATLRTLHRDYKDFSATFFFLETILAMNDTPFLMGGNGTL